MKYSLIMSFLLSQVLMLMACHHDTNTVGCTSQEDCRGARVCLDGVCRDTDRDVTPSADARDSSDANHDARDARDAQNDQDIHAPDDTQADDVEEDSIETISDVSHDDAEAPICPEVCTGDCHDNVCYIEVDTSGMIVCPDGLECVVHCGFDGSCLNSIECGDDKCTVLCEGDDSCRGTIDCGSSSQCTIRCLGFNACNDMIYCGDSDCSIECGQPDNREYTCNGGIDCGTNSCQVACLDDRSCTLGLPTCEGEDCGGAFTCNQADYCRCIGPGCWPTPD